MVAYSFKTGFAAEIVSGRKQQTIRNPRKRHARAGETLQLFTGMRTRACRRLGEADCVLVGEVRLDFTAGLVTLDDVDVATTPAELDAFARLDGFDLANPGFRAWEVLRRWWAVTHPGSLVYRGVLIRWGDTFRPAGVVDRDQVDLFGEAA